MFYVRIQHAGNRSGNRGAQKGVYQAFSGRLEYDNERNEWYRNPTVSELRYDEKHPVEEEGMVGIDEGKKYRVKMS